MTKQTFKELINIIIENAEPVVYRGKPTNRKLFLLGEKYFDTNIPNIEKVPKRIKKYFKIPKNYDTCLVNVYEHGNKIGMHTDKKKYVNINYNILSVSIGINNEGGIITDDTLKLGWMEINGKKIDIINNKIITLDYESPHRAVTRITKNMKYRINFTFRVSNNEHFEKFSKNLFFKYFSIYNKVFNNDIYEKDCPKNPEFVILNDIDNWQHPLHINELEEGKKIEIRLKKYKMQIIKALYLDSIENKNRYSKIVDKYDRFIKKTFIDEDEIKAKAKAKKAYYEDQRAKFIEFRKANKEKFLIIEKGKYKF